MGDLPTSIGPYRVIRMIGEGGMGIVYEAKNEAIGRRVAIKVLRAKHASDAEFTARFFNEARAVNLVDHPGLVQVSDYGQLPDGVAYIVMEYLKGESLDQRLKRTGRRLPVGEVLQLGWQLADSLAAAHHKGIVHRDLKPENVMMVPDPHTLIGERAKLLDFGIAKLSEEPGRLQMVKTQNNAVLGTPYYMSPEQCEGAGNVDVKSDVYSLGCMLYEMLSGRPPFVAQGPGRVFSMHIMQEPEPLRKLSPTVPAPIAELVHRLLRKDREQRPTMRQLASELEALFKTVPTPAKKIFDLTSDDPSSISEISEINTSTLGMAAAQSSTTQRRKIGLIAGLSLAAVLISVGFALHGRKPLPVAKPTVLPKPIEVPVPKTVTLRIDSEPVGAEVVRVSDGQVLGKTPWRQSQAAMPGQLQLQLRLDGFSEQQVSLRTDDNDGLQVRLAALPGPHPKRVPIPPGKHHTGAELMAPSGIDLNEPAESSPRGKRPPREKKLPIYAKPPLED